MLRYVRKLLPALVFAFTPMVLNAQPAVIPLLPDDNAEHVAFTKQSFDALLQKSKSLSDQKMPNLASGINSMSHEAALKAAVDYLLAARVNVGGSFSEGALPTGGSGLTKAWPYSAGGTVAARSTYGEIGLALLYAWDHSGNSTTLQNAIKSMADEMVNDYTVKSGPISGTTKPFMTDVLFLLKVSESGFSGTSTYGDIAATLFERLRSARPAASDEVDRIVTARTTQGAKELSGYDIAWLYLAASSIGSSSKVTGGAVKTNAAAYAAAVRTAYNGLGGSWEVNGAGSTNAQVRTSTGNMLSRGLLALAGLGDSGLSVFLTASQETSAGANYGAFMPAGNVQSNGYIIAALRKPGCSIGAYRGCKYLLEYQNTDGSWYSYPLTSNTDIYPSEVAAALSGLANAAYVVSVSGIKDREGSTSLSRIPVVLKNEDGDTAYKVTSNGAAEFYAVLDTNLIMSFPVSTALSNALKGIVITSTDASYILEQAVKSPPFGTDSPNYGTGSIALQAANLAKSTSFTGGSVNSQIAAEILRFSVGLSSQYPPIYFDLSMLDGASLKDTLRVLYDHSGTMNFTAAKNFVLRGDITNSMKTSGGLPSTSTLLASAGAVESPFRLALDNLGVQSGSLSLQVRVAGISSSDKGPRAFQYLVTYDPSLVKYNGLELSAEAAGFMYAVNDSEPGRLRIAMAGGIPLRADCVIASLRFVPLGTGVAPIFGLNSVMIEDKIADVESAVYSALQADAAYLPKAFSLSQNQPNPFNPSTTISYTIPEGAEPLKVNLSVFNMRGQLVNCLVDRDQAAGTYSVNWDGRGSDGRSVASGVYFYRIQAGKYSQVRKMIILK
ncbi:T9SS type A sorting domain-containing protein [bacterium]|nr:T9SS type A sorting domain-containing protein [bacterium]